MTSSDPALPSYGTSEKISTIISWPSACSDQLVGLKIVFSLTPCGFFLPGLRCLTIHFVLVTERRVAIRQVILRKLKEVGTG